MEEMFSEADKKMIKKELDLLSDSQYEKYISILYFSRDEKKNKILGLLSQETKENFSILESIINKRFQKNIK